MKSKVNQVTRTPQRNRGVKKIHSYTEHFKRKKLFRKSGVRFTPSKSVAKREVFASYSMDRRINENSHFGISCPLVVKFENEDGTNKEIVINSEGNIDSAVKKFCKENRLSTKFAKKMEEICKNEIEKKSAAVFQSNHKRSIRSQIMSSGRSMKEKKIPKLNLNKIPRKKKRPSSARKIREKEEIFERLWFDATQGKKLKEKNYKQIRDKIYPFQPNYGKPRCNNTEEKRKNFFMNLSRKKIKNLKRNKYLNCPEEEKSKNKYSASNISLIDSISTYANDENYQASSSYKMNEIRSMQRVIEKYKVERNYKQQQSKKIGKKKQYLDNSIYDLLKKSRSKISKNSTSRSKGFFQSKRGEEENFVLVNEENSGNDFLSRVKQNIEKGIMMNPFERNLDSVRMFQRNYEKSCSLTNRYSKILNYV